MLTLKMLPTVGSSLDWSAPAASLSLLRALNTAHEIYTPPLVRCSVLGLVGVGSGLECPMQCRKGKGGGT